MGSRTVQVPRPGHEQQAAISAPEVHFDATVSARGAAPVGGPVRVGAVQQLVQTERKNPTFRFDFFVNDTSNSFGADTVTLTIHGHRDARRTVRGNNRQSAAVTFRFNEVIDANGLRASSRLQIMAHAERTLAGSNTRFFDWAQPFADVASGNFLPWNDGDGQYQIQSASIADE